MTETMIPNAAKPVEYLHYAVAKFGYSRGLSLAHQMLGTQVYHGAYGRWEIEDQIIRRHESEPIVVQERRTR